MFDLVSKSEGKFQILTNRVVIPPPLCNALRQLPGLRLAVYPLELAVALAVPIVDLVALKPSVQEIEPRQMHVDEERLKTARLLGLVIEINGQQRLLLRGVHHQRPL
jgi:hypothetical protein